ncbi:putative 2-aminoethylphosphonate ABC transporter ATP-binding protein [Aestuariispira insulae]|uniref:Iron(III) transport system ATP-binding protein n=1 Tax=Aestuariispira insulae TaxID=1461337 RepID=A0A3D9HJK6_9PROT|nr:putative 2-aminoethylphosphonate ABC transporter ATP-binding protein [Aestuariispira insulae]RED49680.1 iron(III) transport system ATP-binding protein [Aestuariispira insulae]
MADKEKYLRIQNVVKKFGDFTALKDVSLEIEEGEFICFLGPSGCGKTTLLRAIAGLDIQTSGQVFQAGRDISALPPSERDFGIVFQSYALFPNMTVSKNVAYGLENQKLEKSQIEKRVRELLETVGLPEQGEKYPAQLSGGQQQRVALARAIATSPGLLLLDEPLSALDARVRVHLRHEIKELQRRLGVTTIMVTHDQEEALTMADRIVVMNDGVIEQIGTPIDVYRKPECAFVADFVGHMNFMNGQVVESDRIQIGSQQLAAKTNGHKPGQAVQVAFRPEDLVAVEDGDMNNAISVNLKDIEFLGSFFRADLTGGDLGQSTINADFSINLSRRVNLEKGRELKIRVPADHIRLFPMEG